MRERAQRLFQEYFRKDAEHPLLKGHYVLDQRKRVQAWSISIGYSYRALALRNTSEGVETFAWYWIGSHEEYNGRVGTGKT